MELQPSSSRALCHLGTGQLAEHEATGDEASLCQAELSFRASIAMEGKPVTPDSIPTQLAEQLWWKQKMEAKTTKTEKEKAAPQAAGQSSNQKGGTAAKQPVVPASRAGPQAGRGRGAQPAGRKPAGPTTASRQPPRAAGRGAATASGRASQGAKTPAKAPGGKNVATLGELKSGSGPAAAAKKPTTTTAAPPPSKSQESDKPAEASLTPVLQQPTQVNKKSHHARLGLARVLAKRSAADKAKLDESRSLYQEVVSMAPELHDAYIELGEMLAKTDPVAAVDAYSRFPFCDPPSFNDAYLHGEIVRLLMGAEAYEDQRLLTSLVAMGRALGIAVLEKQVAVLEAKFKFDLLKKVYSGVHGKPVDDPDLQAFFKFKCWR